MAGDGGDAPDTASGPDSHHTQASKYRPDSACSCSAARRLCWVGTLADDLTCNRQIVGSEDGRRSTNFI